MGNRTSAIIMIGNPEACKGQWDDLVDKLPNGTKYKNYPWNVSNNHLEELKVLYKEVGIWERPKIFFVVPFKTNETIQSTDLATIPHVICAANLKQNGFSIIFQVEDKMLQITKKIQGLEEDKEFQVRNKIRQIQESLPVKTTSIFYHSQTTTPEQLRKSLAEAPLVKIKKRVPIIGGNKFPYCQKSLSSLLNAQSCTNVEEWNDLFNNHLDVVQFTDPLIGDHAILFAWWAVIAKKNRQQEDFFLVAKRWMRHNKLSPTLNYNCDQNETLIEIIDQQKKKICKGSSWIECNDKCMDIDLESFRTVHKDREEHEEVFLQDLIRECNIELVEEFNEFLKTLCGKLKGEITLEFQGKLQEKLQDKPQNSDPIEVKVEVGPVKSYERTVQKKRELESENNPRPCSNRIGDLMRCKFCLTAVNDVQMKTQVENVKEIFDFLSKNTAILRVKNKLADKDKTRTILVNINYKNTIAEVQIMFNKVAKFFVS